MDQISISDVTYSESTQTLQSEAYFVAGIRAINKLGQFALNKSRSFHELDANSISRLFYFFN